MATNENQGEKISKAEAKCRDLSELETHTSADLYQTAIAFNAAQGADVPAAQEALKHASIQFARVALAKEKIRARVTKMRAKRLDRATRMLESLKKEAEELGISLSIG